LLDEMTSRGMSVPEVAREFEVGKHNLYNWKKKFSREGRSVEFQEIPLSVPQVSSVEIHYKGRHKDRLFSPDPEIKELKTEKPCCSRDPF